MRTNFSLHFIHSIISISAIIICIIILSFTSFSADTDIPCGEINSIFYEDTYGIRIVPQEVNGEYYLFLPADADFSDLPIFSELFVLVGENEIEEICDGSVDLQLLFHDTLVSGVEYSVIAIDSFTENSTTIKIMKAANISTISIVSDKTISEINSSKDISGHGSITMIDPFGSKIISPSSDVENLSKFKGRGNTGWELSGEKKPYAITLASKAELIPGAGKSKKWNLISDNCQASFVHEAAGLANIVAYSFYQKVGGAFPVTFAPVNLYVNGEYRGIYLLTEKVEIGSTRVDIGSFNNEEDESDSTVIIRDEDLPVVASKWSEVNLDNAVYSDPSDDPALATGIQAYSYATNSSCSSCETGGFLLELDSRFFGEASWFITRRGYAYVLKDPEFATREQVQMIAQYVQDYEDAVFSDSGFNCKGHYYTNYIDLDSIAAKLAVDFASGQVDQFISSCYFCVDVKDGKCCTMYAGPAWDYDGSNYSTTFNEGLFLKSENIPQGGKLIANPQYMEIMFLKHGDFAKALYDIATGPLKSIFTEYQSSKLSDWIDTLRPSQNMNDALWNADGTNSRASDFDTFAARFSARCDVWTSTWDNPQYLRGFSVEKSGSSFTLINTPCGTASTFQWFKADEDDPAQGTAIPGATSSEFIPSESGIYYLAVTADSLPGMRTAVMYSKPLSYCLTHDYEYTNAGVCHSVNCSRCTNTFLQPHSFISGRCICGAEEAISDSNYASDLQFSKIAISMQSSLGLQFILSNTVYDSYERVWIDVYQTGYNTVTGTDTDPFAAAYTAIDGAGYHGFEVKVKATEMTEPLDIVLYGEKDGTIYRGEHLQNYSVRAQAVTMANAALCDSMSNKAVLQLQTIADMLVYGASAQTQFNYRTSDLATDGVSVEIMSYKTTALPDLTPTVTVEGTGTVTLYRSALALESMIEQQLIFKFASGATISNYEAHIAVQGVKDEVIIDGSEFAGSGRYWGITFSDFSTNKMDYTITVTIYDKATGQAVSPEITSSINAMAADMYNKTTNSDAQRAAALTCMNYGASSKLYFD